jgi:hypothetical protein
MEMQGVDLCPAISHPFTHATSSGTFTIKVEGYLCSDESVAFTGTSAAVELAAGSDPVSITLTARRFSLNFALVFAKLPRARDIIAAHAAVRTCAPFARSTTGRPSYSR